MRWNAPWARWYENYYRALAGFGAIHSTDPNTGVRWIEVPAGTIVVSARIGRRTVENAFSNPRPLLVAETTVTRAQWLRGAQLARSRRDMTIVPPLAQAAQAAAPSASSGGDIAEMLRSGQGGSTQILQRGSGRYGQQTEQDRRRQAGTAVFSPVVENPPPMDLRLNVGSHQDNRDPNMPADNVNFFEAAEWCKRIGARLPTRDEWAFATMSGQDRPNPYGPIEQIAWFAENSGLDDLYLHFIHYGIWENHIAPMRARGADVTKNSLLDSISDDEEIPDFVFADIEDASRDRLIEVEQWYSRIRSTGSTRAYVEPFMHPVGLKQPNRLGLFDMLGNTWEWTVTATSAAGASNPSALVVGGSFNTDADEMEFVNIAQRSQWLTWATPGIGFRPVKDIQPRPPSRVEMLEILSEQERVAAPPAPIPVERMNRPLEIAEPESEPLQPVPREAAAYLANQRMQMMAEMEREAPPPVEAPAAPQASERVKLLDLDDPSAAPPAEGEKPAEETTSKRVSQIEFDGLPRRYRGRGGYRSSTRRYYGRNRRR